MKLQSRLHQNRLNFRNGAVKDVERYKLYGELECSVVEMAYTDT